MRGRKPLPSILHVLHGNPGHREVNVDEPKPAIAIPRPPATLGKEAKKEWRRVCKQLVALGMVTELDRAALSVYCNVWERWLEAEANVRKLGLVVKSPNGFPILNPYVSISNRCVQQLLQVSAEFGLTPSSRSRVKGSRPEEGGDDGEEFLFGRRAGQSRGA